jgi:hypothetical protein
MKAYRHLVKHCIAAGYTVSVYDGEVWEVKRSTKLKEITDCIESVEEAQIRIRNAEGLVRGWALVSAHGLEDDETVIDFSCGEFMADWEESYQKQYAI